MLQRFATTGTPDEVLGWDGLSDDEQAFILLLKASTLIDIGIDWDKGIVWHIPLFILYPT